MKTLKTFTLFCLLSVAFNAISYGQTDSQPSKIQYNTWSVTLSGGSMLFYGDLRQFDFYPVTKQNSMDWYNLSPGLSEYAWGYGLAISKQLTPIFGIQGILEKGELHGMDINADAHFNASILTYGLNMKINILPMLKPDLESPRIAIYGIAGIGFCDFKTRQYSISTNTLLSSYGYGDGNAEKKATTETVIPLGIGIKYKISNTIDIGIESTINNVNTDKLDARIVKGSTKDKYGYTAITLTFNIGGNEKSLEWVTPKEMESDKTAPLFSEMNRKIDSLGNKLKEVSNKANANESNITQLQKDVADLKNPPREADNDKDSVPNSKDLEPNTPKGNLVNFQGITIPRSVNTTIVEKTEATYKIEVGDKVVLNNIFFDFDKATLRPESNTELDRLTKLLKDMPTLVIEISGHTDNVGSAAYNKTLSESRAKSVVDYLLKNGIEKSRLSYIGYGFDQPIATNSTDEGRQKNRRTEFKVISK